MNCSGYSPGYRDHLHMTEYLPSPCHSESEVVGREHRDAGRSSKLSDQRAHVPDLDFGVAAKWSSTGQMSSWLVMVPLPLPSPILLLLAGQ